MKARSSSRYAVRGATTCRNRRGDLQRGRTRGGCAPSGSADPRASVLIGLLDTADAHHTRAVTDTEARDISQRRLVAPATAYSEALVAFAREGGPLMHAVQYPVWASTWSRSPRTWPTCGRASLAARAVRLPDAMVLACAAELDGELSTYDAGWRPSHAALHSGRSKRRAGSAAHGLPSRTAVTGGAVQAPAWIGGEAVWSSRPATA